MHQSHTASSACLDNEECSTASLLAFQRCFNPAIAISFFLRRYRLLLNLLGSLLNINIEKMLMNSYNLALSYNYYIATIHTLPPSLGTGIAIITVLIITWYCTRYSQHQCIYISEHDIAKSLILRSSCTKINIMENWNERQ